jgi:hypothetical protein
MSRNGVGSVGTSEFFEWELPLNDPNAEALFEQ